VRTREGDRIAIQEAGDRAAEDEVRVIARVRSGDTEAFAELVRAHTPFVLRVAVAYGAGAEAEDVVNSAFFKAYEALGGFREGQPFRPWLARIVINETRNTIRSAQRRRAFSGSAYEAALAVAEPLIPDSADPAVALLAAERTAQVRRALALLDTAQREVVTCRYLLEMGEAETAQALGWPRGTVKSRLNRALRKLGRILPPPEEQPTAPEGLDRQERPAKPEKQGEPEKREGPDGQEGGEGR
jgi:RNA polymerase sigma-70 factor (ECF subfamily)